MTNAPSTEELRGRKLDARLVMSIAATGIMSFAGVAVETAMNITFPVLMEEFSVNTATVQWITTGYLLVLAVVVPVSAYLKRRFAMHSLFLAAIALFTAGVLLCLFAPAFWVLLLGRIVQGVGTGIALPLMFNIVIEQAPLDKMGMMMGIANLITAIAPAVGPSVGGFIASTFGWRAIFVALLPLLALSFVMGATSIRQSSETGPAKFAVGQFALLAGSFSCLVFATNSASTAGWLSPRVLVLLAGFAVLLVLFCVVSRRSQHPLVHVECFAHAPFSFSIAYLVLFQMIVLALSYIIPYYAQTVRGLDEFAAGCLLLPGCTIGAILCPFGGKILDRLGPKRPILLGAASQLLAIVLFATVGMGGSIVRITVIYIFITIGQGLSISNSATNGLRYLPDELKTDGNACFNTLQQLGGAMGTATATAIMNSAQTGASDLVLATTAGARQIFSMLLCVSIASVCCAVAVFVAARLQGRRAR